MDHQEIGKSYIAFIRYAFEKMQCDSVPAKKKTQSAAGFCGALLSRQDRQKTFLTRVKGWRLEQGRHTAFSKRLSENDHHGWQQIDSFRPGDERSVEIVYLCHSRRGGGCEGGGEGAGRVEGEGGQ